MIPKLTPDQHQRAIEIARNALAFTQARPADLASAVIRYHWFDGEAADVVAALAPYQNEDGGFGNRLEPDIHAPESNPFAARLAMQIMRLLPREATVGVRAQLGNWLGARQHDDGDWHFSEATTSGWMQPWFAGWEFPSLNPSCCVLGQASSNGIASKRMRTLVAGLWEQKASVERAHAGSFYELLPYVEYTLATQLPDEYLDAIAGNIISVGTGFDDAGHFFDLSLGGSEDIATRIPDDLWQHWIEALLTEPDGDGGWPSPYNNAWRDWTTAGNMSTLAHLRP